VTLYTGTVGCPRCSAEVAEDQAPGGCPACLAGGTPVNLVPRYRRLDGPLPFDGSQPGLFGWRALLPIADSTRPVSLGEGGTPLVAAPALASWLGVRSVLVKDESQNPTWSYKDRLAAVAVTKAVELGKDTVVVASSGNHGAAVAAYAAAARIRCVVLSTAAVAPAMSALLRIYGSELYLVETAADRWRVMAEGVRRLGWFPVSGYQAPPVGSVPFGVDAYKTIAYEIQAQLGPAVPGWVAVPVAYADGLAGIERGYQDLLTCGSIPRAPRMLAAEPLGAHAGALRHGAQAAGEPVTRRATVAFSTASPWATYQGLHALRRSRGTAEGDISDAAILAAQATTARRAGIYMETASAASIAALHRLATRGTLSHHDDVLIVNTSSGLKTTDQTQATLAPPPTIQPTLTALLAARRPHA
jgi:threonine synthase